MSKRLIYLMSFVLVLAVTGTATADQWDIVVPDAGFDDHVLAEGGYIDIADPGYTGPWESHSGDAWIDYGYWAANGWPGDLPARSGNNKAYAYSDYIYQILDETFIEGGTYTLSVWVGQPWEGYASGWRLYLTGEDYTNNLIEASGTAGLSWEQISLVYTATAADAGKSFGIKIWSDDEVSFDDVTLTYDGPPRPPIATNMLPADDAELTEDLVSLIWAAGPTAVEHDVYLGTDLDTVYNATASEPPVDPYKGRQTDIIYRYDGLVPGTTYYWRIDEVEDDGVTIHKGIVWSFWLAPLEANDPSPRDGLKFVELEPELSWAPGFKAVLHTVYFGTDYDTVANQTGGTRRPTTTYDPGALALGTTYYWRVDEFDDDSMTHTGHVWSFTTMPDIPITDPNLVAWWKLDEGEGKNVVDWSGYGHHGTFRGDTQWVAQGYDGAAIQLDGAGDYVNIDGYKGITAVGGVQPAFTLMAWINTTTDAEIITWGNNAGRQRLSFRVDTVLRVEHGSGNIRGTLGPDLRDGQWHHVAAVIQEGGTIDDAGVTLYVDGVNVTPDTSDSDTFNLQPSADVSIGRRATNNDRYFNGMIDDARIYDRTLTQEEIKQAMRGDPTLAWNPSPTNGSTPDIGKAVPLSWSPGDNASQHDVYFGTDRDAVEYADISTAGIYRIRQSGTSYAPPEGAEWGTGPYYWRIDEYNTDGTISKGRVWSFTVADFLSIDDFEDYKGDEVPVTEQIWGVWRDGLGFGSPTAPPYSPGNGTGSEVGDGATNSYTEETTVHGGRQALPYVYNNNKPDKFEYSEAKMTLAALRDWTVEGVKALSLWFQGYPASVGSFVEAPAGTYTMTGSGTDIWNVGPAAGEYHDEFHFAYKQLTGAGTIVARVERVQNIHSWAKAGVMIRDTLEGGSAHGMMIVTPGQGVSFQRRTIAGEASASDTQAGITTPQWVKIERDLGGNMTASYSADGVSWTQQGTELINMNPPLYIGLALTAHDAALTCEAVFSNVTTTDTVSGQWMHQDIGIESNEAERMYVALANNTGTPAVVYHDDPAAAQIDTWTEWNIDLKDFADQGVILTDVNSIAIGFGDRKNPVAGGKGKMYFDDIRLYRPRYVPGKGTPIPADLNSDGVVNFGDLEMMMSDWLADGLVLATDLNADSMVDFKDYAALADAWLNEQLWP